MILLFHSLYFLVQHLLKIYRRAKAINHFQNCRLIGKEVTIHINRHANGYSDIRFNPPLYKQRYSTVQQILLNPNWKSSIKKVVDFGCSELNFFWWLKHLFDIQEIICVDVDEDTLYYNLFKLHPKTADYLKQRPNLLKVQVLSGSASQPDERLARCDAVIAIELIEHLYPDTLEALPYNVFHFIKPLLAIFTTPNYEFNVLFPNAKVFRHSDHKFEWTREQFQSWALNITARFPNYTVQFHGIGGGPEGTESVGCCTQVAVFIRHSEQEQLSEVPKSCREIIKKQLLNYENHNESYGICTYYSYVKQLEAFNDVVNNGPNIYYKEIEYIEYPYYIDNRTPEERILHEVQYKIFSANSASNVFYNEERNRIEYPLHQLVSNENGCFITVSELRKLLNKANFKIEECFNPYCDEETPCVVYSLNMDNHSSSPNSSDENNSDDKDAYKAPWSIAAEESDWETEYNQTIKLNNEPIENEQEHKDEEADDGTVNENDEQNKITYQFHSLLANTTSSIENKEVTQDHSTIKRLSHSKLPGTSVTHSTEKIPKKGTNIKNKDVHSVYQGTSKEKRKNDGKINSNLDVSNKKTFKKSVELKTHDSTYSQGSSVPKNNRSTKIPMSSNAKLNMKGKLMATSSLKRFPTKLEDSSVPGTSDLKKKKKGKKTDEDKDEIKALTECIIYNTLNNVPEIHEIGDEPSSSPNIKNIDVGNNGMPNIEVPVMNDTVGHEIMDQILVNINLPDDLNRNGESNEGKHKDLTTEPTNQELNHASREALFDPNSETDMLEEFEIPSPPSAPPSLDNPAIAQHHNVLLIGLNITNEEESVVLPDNADPFPNWLLQLLGANVEEGESHDEPHFYCQGDGIGVHPSVIEVEIEEEESTSDSSSSHQEAEAGYTSSDSGVIQLPTDDRMEDRTTQDDSTNVDLSVPLSRINPPGSTSTADSTDEFFDTIEEGMPINERTNSQTNKSN